MIWEHIAWCNQAPKNILWHIDGLFRRGNGPVRAINVRPQIRIGDKIDLQIAVTNRRGDRLGNVGSARAKSDRGFMLSPHGLRGRERLDPTPDAGIVTAIGFRQKQIAIGRMLFLGFSFLYPVDVDRNSSILGYSHFLLSRVHVPAVCADATLRFALKLSRCFDAASTLTKPRVESGQFHRAA